jgi:hypothetical protein
MQLEIKKDVPTTVNYIALLMISKNKWHSLTIVNTRYKEKLKWYSKYPNGHPATRSLNALNTTLIDAHRVKTLSFPKRS